MKSFFFILIISMTLAACQSPKPKAETAKTPVVATTLTETTLKVEGMTCTECEQSVAKGVTALPGIDTIRANYLDSTAFVRYDPSKTDVAQITKAIEGRGYQVVPAVK